MKHSQLRPKARKPKRDPDVVWHGPGGEADSHREFVRSKGCLLTGHECSGPIEPHHVVHRSNGGTYRDQVPVCKAHHTGWVGAAALSSGWGMIQPIPRTNPEARIYGVAFPVHQGKKTFAKRYGIDLAEHAARLVREHYPEGVPDDR